MKAEKIITPVNGDTAIIMLFISAGLIVYGLVSNNPLLPAIFAPVFILLLKGLVVISPNSLKVVLLFGKYKGSIE